VKRDLRNTRQSCGYPWVERYPSRPVPKERCEFILHFFGLCTNCRTYLNSLHNDTHIQKKIDQVLERRWRRSQDCFYEALVLNLFVCLFVGINPEKLYSTSCVGREVNPLGVTTHGQRHKSRAYQRQRYIPHTCQSMVKTLQVDGLARITGLSGSYSNSSSATERRPPMPCMTRFWKLKEFSKLRNVFK